MNTNIKRLSTTSGYLANCPTEFDDRLTCIIGARGTCKSTLIESIRFAFDCDKNKVKQLQNKPSSSGYSQEGLITSTLGAGTVRCQVVRTDGKEITEISLEREHYDETRLYLDGVREHTDRNILDNIEIFSQGDLQRLADDTDPSLRLDLIDRPNITRIRKLDEDRRRYSASLLETGKDLRNIRYKLSELVQNIQPLNDLRAMLKEATESSPSLPPELQLQGNLFEQRSRVIIALSDVPEVQSAAISHLLNIEVYIKQLGNSIQLAEEQHQSEASKLISMVSLIRSKLDEALELASQVQQINTSLELQTLKEIFEAANEEYYKSRQEEESVNESLKAQQNLKRQIDHLEKVQKALSDLRENEAGIRGRRDDLRSQIHRIDDELYHLRIAQIEAINEEFGSQVLLTLRIGTGSRGFQETLSTLLTGSRIHLQNEVALEIARTFQPDALIDIVETGTGQALSEALDRDLGQMNRVVSHLIDHEDLYQLEAQPPAVQLEITMFQDGQPKPVETLSKGQKATALLPLILRPFSYPLIFDQPEDDLDNSYIFESLISVIRDLKHKRQLIFVTHNANIPVLGEAEKIIVMSMKNPTEASPQLTGTVDERKQEILNLLEGGKEAFQRREMKYRDIL